jgi:hypothetical protein
MNTTTAISKLALFSGDYEVAITGCAARTMQHPPIAVFITDVTAPRFGSYVYTIGDHKTGETFATVIHESDADTEEMCRNMGRVLTRKFQVPVYTNINGRLDLGSYQELLNHVIEGAANTIHNGPR